MNMQNKKNTTQITRQDIEEAKMYLGEIMEMTENAADKTMDITKLCRKNIKEIKSTIDTWCKDECAKVDASSTKKQLMDLKQKLSGKIVKTTDSLSDNLTEIVVAQAYQDLTGQRIKKILAIIDLLLTDDVLIDSGDKHDHSDIISAQDDVDAILREMKNN